MKNVGSDYGIALQGGSQKVTEARDVTHELIVNSVLRYIALEPNTKQKKKGKLDGKVRYVQDKTVLKLNLEKLDTVRPKFSTQKTHFNRHTFV